MDLKTQDDTEVLFNQQGESGVLDAAGGGGRLSESGCWVMLSWAWGERQACCSLQRGRNLLPIFVAPPLPEGRRSYMILICNSSFKHLPPFKKRKVSSRRSDLRGRVARKRPSCLERWLCRWRSACGCEFKNAPSMQASPPSTWNQVRRGGAM